ncbi:MAG: hypothetical protein ACI945_001089 [Pseudohongiellaceae bacterium]|jgi:hypothetical protein
MNPIFTGICICSRVFRIKFVLKDKIPLENGGNNKDGGDTTNGKE